MQYLDKFFLLSVLKNEVNNSWNFWEHLGYMGTQNGSNLKFDGGDC